MSLLLSALLKKKKSLWSKKITDPVTHFTAPQAKIPIMQPSNRASAL
jgi:hypothetical protein